MSIRFDYDELALNLQAGVADVVSGTDSPMACLDAIKDIGIIDMLVPEEHGGLGVQELQMVGVFVALGRTQVPGPLLETVCLKPALPSTFLSDGGLLAWGTTGDMVAWFDAAEKSVVSTTPHELNEIEHAVELPSVDSSRPIFGSLQTGGSVSSHKLDIDRAWLRGTLGSASLIFGGMQEAIELSLEHVMNRKQFGRAVGTFQALKHQLAEARIEADLTEPMLLKAAWAMQELDLESARMHVYAAKYFASQAARKVMKIALQCHGGMGYTTEHILPSVIKRSWSEMYSFADPGRCSVELVKRLPDYVNYEIPTVQDVL